MHLSGQVTSLPEGVIEFDFDEVIGPLTLSARQYQAS